MVGFRRLLATIAVFVDNSINLAIVGPSKMATDVEFTTLVSLIFSIIICIYVLLCGSVVISYQLRLCKGNLRKSPCQMLDPFVVFGWVLNLSISSVEFSVTLA